FQRICDLARAHRRAHHRAEKNINADRPSCCAVAWRTKCSAVIFVQGPDQANIEATHEHALARQLDTRRRLSFLDQAKRGARASPVMRTGMRFALAPPMILVNLHGHYSGPG